MVTILAAIVWPGDKFTAMNAVGLLIIFVGAGMYNAYRYEQMKAAGAGDREGEDVVGD